ncbi:sulfur oxidation c-type cytochrome SoxX [Oricola nitratireducens]|uniref:sulfur oxidation c-type cytochrome SoxX n=1 Tax=Oricola nitratireducens TaxID=2775868 RepID=UPI001867DF53|nr:sulfur oxidation c-type cytochrome SoxX [Oricola nitratireducens]
MVIKARTWLVAAAAVMASTAVAYSSEMAPQDVKIEDNMVSASLTGGAGDAAEGRKIFANRKLGNCLACHAVSDQSEQLFHGDVGPSLDGVADRWSPEELRAIVVNSKAVFTKDTIMPGFYSLDVGVHVRKDLVGKTILTAQQVEDVVAYLATLKE